MHKIVLSNTSPIFYLNKIGHLELLKRLYGEITIPRSGVVGGVASGQLKQA